jgi:hypothetical protein
MIGRLALVASLVSTSAYLYPVARVSALYLFPDTRAEAMVEASLISLDSRAVEEGIDGALAKDDADLATSFVRLAEARGITVDGELQARVEEASGFDIGRSAGEAWDGFVSGNADTPTAFAASVAADLSVAGDVRDLYRELSAYPDHDELTVGLAAMGVVATGATFVSGMNALPVKAGVSLIKSARKAGKLPPPLAREMRDIAARSIDTSAITATVADLRRLDATAASASVRRVVRPELLERLGTAASDLGGIAGMQGYRATLQTLELASSTGDISRLRRISTKFGDGYRAVLRVAGTAGVLTWKIGSFAAVMVWWLLGMMVWAIGALLVAADLGAVLVGGVKRVLGKAPASGDHFSTNA